MIINILSLIIYINECGKNIVIFLFFYFCSDCTIVCFVLSGLFSFEEILEYHKMHLIITFFNSDYKVFIERKVEM